MHRHVTSMRSMPVVLLASAMISAAVWDLAPAEARQEPSADCQDLKVLARLARIGGPSEVAEKVATQMLATCAAGGPVKTWQGGGTARLSQNSWTWPPPSKKTAKRSPNSFDYPNGRTAKRSQYSWDYPDGKTARRSATSFSKPDGSSATLHALTLWACAVVGQVACQPFMKDIAGPESDERTLAIIELALKAHSLAVAK